jgi:hypothetical protein
VAAGVGANVGHVHAASRVWRGRSGTELLSKIHVYHCHTILS